MKKLFVAILALLLSSCVATTTQVTDLDKRLKSLEKKSVLQLAEEAAGTKMYGATSLEGGVGTGALDRFAYSSLADGDLCIVISSGIVYFYTFDDDSALTENSPWVIEPYDTTTEDGRWILASAIYLKNDDTSASSIRLYEDYTTGQNYFDLQAPSSIIANQTFVLGKLRISSLTLTSSTTSVTVDDTDKLYYVDISGLTGNYGLSLPTTTGSGMQISIYVIDDTGDSDIFVIEPNGTDRIVGKNISGTNADGDYIYPSDSDTSGAAITLVDSAAGRWTVKSMNGTWSWQ